jgi:(E)-4-hydroxy-3-methylbut-2-enyl-diphosphate synthase
MRKPKRIVAVGSVKLGGFHPIAVQSMTKTKTHDVSRTIRQIRRLERARCEIVRVAVVNRDDAAALKKIKESIRIPLVADIHFDYRLALTAIDAGVDKIRINPGNIGDARKIAAITKRAQDKNIPIRIGVNSGSLPRTVLKKFKHPTAQAIVETVRRCLDIFRRNRFYNIVISAKGVDVDSTIKAYTILDKNFQYPLHLGITEAGLPFRGGIKSAVGLAILLHQGIGDTIRVSLTGDPVLEVVAAFEILHALELRKEHPVLISCPMCGRCDVALEKIAHQVDQRLARYDAYIKVAVMGCVVNGPGEAREADFGIACGKHRGIVFAKGKELKRVRESQLVDALFEVIDENINH